MAATHPVVRFPRLLLALLLLAGVWAALPAPVGASSTFEVTTCADALSPAPAGSLRAALAAANADDMATADEPHVITFALDPPCDTITLAGAHLTINNHVDIQGPGADALTVSGNLASRVFLVEAGVTATIAGLTIADGNVTEGISIGGGIRNRGNLTVVASVLTRNTASWGGAILNDGDASELTVLASTLTTNTAEVSGGAISVAGAVWVINSTISGNTASFGGGIASGDLDSTLSILSSTLSGNTASGSGQNLHVSGSEPATLSRTIVAGGERSSCAYSRDGTITSLGYNLATDSTCGLDATKGDIINGVPDLVPLNDNGGTTPTHALGPSSQARDVIPAEDCADVTVDQRGVDRPYPASGRCDIGAFEDVSDPPASVSITIDADAPWTASRDVTLAFSATDDRGIVSYALAATHEGLDTTTPTELVPSEPSFNRTNVSFELSAGADGARAVWLRVCDVNGQCVDDSDTIVLDTTAPTVTAPDITVVSPDGNPVIVAYPDVVATDDGSGVAEGWPQCNPPSESVFPVGETEVECAAQDNLGHEDRATFVVRVVRDWVQGCLYAGALTQLSTLDYGAAPTIACARGELVVLEQGEGYFACLYAGSLTQVGTSEPINCGRGVSLSFAAGDDLHGCLYAGRLSQLGYTEPASCGRGEHVGLALGML